MSQRSLRDDLLAFLAAERGGWIGRGQMIVEIQRLNRLAPGSWADGSSELMNATIDTLVREKLVIENERREVKLAPVEKVAIESATQLGLFD